MSDMASDAKTCFSSKVEYCAVVQYLCLNGKTSKEIHVDLANVYGSSATSYALVKLFQYMFYMWVQNCTLIKSFFNKILNVKHG